MLWIGFWSQTQFQNVNMFQSLDCERTNGPCLFAELLAYLTQTSFGRRLPTSQMSDLFFANLKDGPVAAIFGCYSNDHDHLGKATQLMPTFTTRVLLTFLIFSLPALSKLALVTGSIAAEPRKLQQGLIFFLFRAAPTEGKNKSTISIQPKAQEIRPRVQSAGNIWKQFSQRGSCHLGWKVGEGRREVFAFLVAELISPTSH